MKKKDFINIFIVLLLIFFGIWRTSKKTYTFKDVRIMLDTTVEITYESKNKKSFIDSTFALIKNLEEKLSAYNGNSYVSKFNLASTKQIKINNQLNKILQTANKISKQTNGLYDIALENLINVWDFKNCKIPSQNAIQTALKSSGSQFINISKNTLTKTNKNVKINLGSIAKGYIIDEAIEFLKSHGAINAVVNAGGDLKIYNSNNKPKKYQIGVQHPRIKGKLIDTLFVNNKAVVTSGDYERFFIKDNIRYHHILNPKTGYPAKNTISVTVISNSAMLADALSTACFVLKPVDAISLVKKYPNTSVMIFYKDDKKQIICLKTEGMKEYLNEK